MLGKCLENEGGVNCVGSVLTKEVVLKKNWRVEESC